MRIEKWRKTEGNLGRKRKRKRKRKRNRNGWMMREGTRKKERSGMGSHRIAMEEEYKVAGESGKKV